MADTCGSMAASPGLHQVAKGSDQWREEGGHGLHKAQAAHCPALASAASTVCSKTGHRPSCKHFVPGALRIMVHLVSGSYAYRRRFWSSQSQISPDGTTAVSAWHSQLSPEAETVDTQ